MKPTPAKSLFTVGQRVQIVGETRDYQIVRADEGKGRVDVSPVVWTHGPLKPMETVSIEHVRLVP